MISAYLRRLPPIASHAAEAWRKARPYALPVARAAKDALRATEHASVVAWRFLRDAHVGRPHPLSDGSRAALIGLCATPPLLIIAGMIFGTVGDGVYSPPYESAEAQRAAVHLMMQGSE